MENSEQIKTALDAAKLFVLKHPDDVMAVPMIRLLDEAVLLTRTQPKHTREELVDIVASKILTAPTPYGLAGVTDAVDTLIEARALQVKE